MLFEYWELVMDKAWNEQHKTYIPVRLLTVSGMFTIFFTLSKTLQEGAPHHHFLCQPFHTLQTYVIQYTAVLLGFVDFCL
jgi:hypothetical protein